MSPGRSSSFPHFKSQKKRKFHKPTYNPPILPPASHTNPSSREPPIWFSQPLGPPLSSLPSPSWELPSQTSLSSWNQRHQSSRLINLLSTTHGGSTANPHLQPTMVITPRLGSYHRYPLQLMLALAQKYPTLCLGNLICSHWPGWLKSSGTFL